MHVSKNELFRPIRDGVPNSEIVATAEYALFDRLAQRSVLDGCGPLAIFLYGNGGSTSAALWEWVARQGAELVLRHSGGTSREWISENAEMFDCMFVDGDYFQDVEDTVDFCIAVRRTTPNLPILLLSSDVRASDFSSARRIACDATLKWPASSGEIADGLNAMFENHSRFLRDRLPSST